MTITYHFIIITHHHMKWVCWLYELSFTAQQRKATFHNLKIYFSTSFFYNFTSSSRTHTSFRWEWLQPIKSLSCPLPWKEKQRRRFGLFWFQMIFIAISLMFNENLNISGVSSHGIDISAFEFWQPLSHYIGSKFYQFCTNPKNSEFQFSYWSVQKNFHLIGKR